jgi:hypothetical protein
MSREPGLITLIRTSTGWSAKFSGEAAASVREAFGTDTIPTAFTAEAPAKAVEKELRAMWPKCVVTVGDAQ